MALSANRRAPGRRVVLVLDCLEDRATPAAFDMFGQTIADFVPARIDLDASAVGRFAIAAPMPVFSVIHAAGPNDVPFGFFHPFSQNGFGITAMIGRRQVWHCGLAESQDHNVNGEQ